MPRTDVHRPSAINPDDYQFVSCDYFGGGFDALAFVEERKRFRLHMEKTGGLFASKHNSGSCHICGANALYVVRYYHTPSNSYITTGMDCADKMDIGEPEAFRKFRAEVHNYRKTKKGRKLAKETLALLGLSDAWKYYEYGFDDYWRKEEPIIQSIVSKLVKYGTMSEAQATLIQKLLGQIANRAAADAERAARIAQEKETSKHVGEVGARMDFELTISFCTSFDTQYGTMHVHSMKDAAGNVVVYKGAKIGERGQSLLLKATVKSHSEYKGVR